MAYPWTPGVDPNDPNADPFVVARILAGMFGGGQAAAPVLPSTPPSAPDVPAPAPSPDNPFGVAMPQVSSPQLETSPQPGFLQSALMQILSSLPMFAPERNKYGEYPSGLSRVAGYALPALAHGAAGALESGVRSRQATVNARNIAATEKARAENAMKEVGYSTSVTGASRVAQEKEAQRGATLRAVMNAGKDENGNPLHVVTASEAKKWGVPEGQTFRGSDWLDFIKPSGAAARGGLTFEQQELLTRLRGENPRMNYELQVIESNDKKRRDPIQRRYDNLTKFPTNDPRRQKVIDDLGKQLDVLSQDTEAKKQAVLTKYQTPQAAPGAGPATPKAAPAKAGPVAPAPATGVVTPRIKFYVSAAQQQGMTPTDFSLQMNDPQARAKLEAEGVNLRDLQTYANQVLLRNPNGIEVAGRR
jgi:hypothetical protein